MSSANSQDLLWVLLCSVLVMLMQAGFCCLETGMSRAKNSINVAIKNLFDFCIASAVFWLLGFGIMFGASWYGVIGTSDFALDGMAGPALLTFFMFQLVFCGTSTTIISGAVAERMRFSGYLIVSLLVSAIIYPIFGHWVWGGANTGSPTGWLAQLGFIDFAGCAVVHSVGGWISLAAVLIIGPRIGRFKDGSPAMTPHNLPMTALGVFLLWFGWFGFNGGSALAFDGRVPLILVNTNLAAAAGGIGAIAASWCFFRNADACYLMNGVLAGLVGVTASCHMISPGSALAIGLASGVLASYATRLLERLKIDDVVGAVPVHLVGGTFGTLAVAIFGFETAFQGHTRLEQLGIQLAGIGACALWSFGVGGLLLFVINRWLPLRVREDHELLGLNIAEHGATSDLTQLLEKMDDHRRLADFSTHVPVEPHTEVGEIAREYNLVLDKVDYEIRSRTEVVEALRSAEAKYRRIFENAIEGIFQTSPNGTYLSANPALARIYGYESVEQLINSIGDISRQLYVDPTSRQAFVDVMAQYGRVVGFEAQIFRRDGTIAWISENAQAVCDTDGRLLYYEGTVEDITDQKRTKQLQKERDVADAANQAKSDFLANMSHELRTPLNGVIGMLDLLSGLDMPSKQGRYVDIARSSADVLLTVINQVLDFSKIESGKLDLESIEFDLRSTLEDTAEILVQRADQNGLELMLSMHPEVPANLIGDPNRLRQVLINLTNNAIKFTEQGHVAIKAAVEHETATHAHVRFNVTDTGIGIPPDRLDRLFKSFSQVDASTTRRYGGTGLGLAISKQLVELMGGSIGVESTIGVGSTFWFVIPFAKCDSLLRAKPIVPARLAKLRVLGVDDNETNREILKQQLTNWQIDVEVTPSAIHAIGVMHEAHRQGKAFDLAILDGQMPDVDGFELARQIKNDPVLRTTRMVMLTSIGNTLDAAEMAELGLSSYLTKPARQSRLFNAILNATADDAGHLAVATQVKPQLSKSKYDKPRVGATPTANETATDRPRRGRLLLAEDNEINQMVASEIVKRAGYECEVVENGRAAIEAVEGSIFDLVLMDCHMPELDGLEATRAIRQRETATAGRRLPIIALTANAAVGDRERCLEAGMDGYLSKPINPEKLINQIEELLALVQRELEPTPTVATEIAVQLLTRRVTDAPFTVDALYQRCLGDREFAQRMLDKFAARAMLDLKSLGESIANRDAEKAGREAHSLKGAASNLSAELLRQCALDLETSCVDKNWSAAEQHLVRVDAEVRRCCEFIQTCELPA